MYHSNKLIVVNATSVNNYQFIRMVHVHKQLCLLANNSACFLLLLNEQSLLKAYRLCLTRITALHRRKILFRQKRDVPSKSWLSYEKKRKRILLAITTSRPFS